MVDGISLDIMSAKVGKVVYEKTSMSNWKLNLHIHTYCQAKNTYTYIHIHAYYEQVFVEVWGYMSENVQVCQNVFISSTWVFTVYTHKHKSHYNMTV